MTAENTSKSKRLNQIGKKANNRNLSFCYLSAQFECVNFLSLLAQSLIHTTQVVAHHAELVFIAPLSCSQFILYERHHCYNVF